MASSHHEWSAINISKFRLQRFNARPDLKHVIKSSRATLYTSTRVLDTYLTLCFFTPLLDSRPSRARAVGADAIKEARLYGRTLKTTTPRDTILYYFALYLQLDHALPVAARLFANPASIAPGPAVTQEEWYKDGRKLWRYGDCDVVSWASYVVRKPLGCGTTLDYEAEGESFFPMSSLKSRQWGKDDYWYLGFLPQYTSFVGDAAFHPLSTPFAQLPIVGSAEQYCLREDVMREWYTLEELVITTHNALHRKYLNVYPLDTRWPVAPSRFGYMSSYSSPDAARKRAQMSRRAFLPWICVLSMHIAESTMRERVDSPPGWYRYLALQHQSRIPAYWLDLLNKSHLVSDFSPSTPRQGFVIDMSREWQLFQFVGHYEKAGVPLWYLFPHGYKPHYREAKLLYPPYGIKSNMQCNEAGNMPCELLRPRHVGIPPIMRSEGSLRAADGHHGSTSSSQRIADVDELRTDDRPPEAEYSSSMRPGASPGSHVSSAEHIAFDCSSGQLPGETMKMFFARRVKEDEERERKESPEQRRKRGDAIQRADGPRGKYLEKKAEVFVWEDIDVFPYSIRRRCTFHEKYDLWDDYTSDQKIYHSFTNSWDLSESFAPLQNAAKGCGVPGCRDSYCDHDEDEQIDVVPSVAKPLEHRSSLTAPSSSSASSSMRNSSLVELERLIFGRANLEQFQDVLRFRYGFRSELYNPQHRPEPSMKLIDALRTVVEKSRIESVQDQRTLLWLRDLVGTLLKEGRVSLAVSDVSLNDGDFHARYNNGLLRRLPEARCADNRRLLPIGTLDYSQQEWFLAVETRVSYREILRRRWGSDT
ncbi:hypothetical protein K474DRAFT_1709749 [Panus rudis PR-1116 ss-1]|nr:hypothetical protein K474DRAFT_1709749 [Panus rudis PR-1116 ss-1]